MLRPLRRPLRPTLALVGVAALLVGVLAGCGDVAGAGSGGVDSSAEGLAAVTIAGDVGQEPDVTWKSSMTATTADVSTVTTGTGAALAKGDKAYMNYWVGDGYTQKSAIFNTFGAKSKGVELTVGTVPSDLTSIDDLVQAFIASQLKAGVTVGSRVAITVGATNMFGQNVFATDVVAKNIGNNDGILIIADIESKILPGPDGTQQSNPSWSPTITFTKAVPSALDFKGITPLGDKLKVAILRKGTGEPVKTGDHIVVDYLGQTVAGKKPFDQSYTTQDFITPIGSGAVVKGWDQGLVGVPVGSRVMLGIPSALGYGKAGQGTDIPPNTDLYFVIDVLAAAP